LNVGGGESNFLLDGNVTPSFSLDGSAMVFSSLEGVIMLADLEE
jgi:hypothetical protein